MNHGSGQHREDQQHGPHGGDGSAALAQLLDLDAEVLHGYLGEVIGWLRQLAGDARRDRILDLGAGTGTGSIALARCFPEAQVIAVDSSVEMLGRIDSKSGDLGLADRIRTLQADLNRGWPAVEDVDIAWASNALHEMTDPQGVLHSVFTAIRPGGIFAVAELDGQPRFFPDELGRGRPGLETRLRAALRAQQGASAPHPGIEDWGRRLEQAGFTIVGTKSFAIDLGSAQSSSVGRYAFAYLSRIRPALPGLVAPDDLAVLDTILHTDGPYSILHRTDLRVRSTRTVWIARRPAILDGTGACPPGGDRTLS